MALRAWPLILGFAFAAMPLCTSAQEPATCSGYPLCPDRAFTTGEVATTDKTTVCNRSTKTVRDVTTEEKQGVFAKYSQKYHIAPDAPLIAEDVTPSTGAADVDTVRVRGRLDPNVKASPGPHGALYEIDHLIPLELGGSNNASNLWPQSYVSPWGAHIKDELENTLHRLVCAGNLSLPVAQHAIQSDWIAAYHKYVEGK